MELLTALLAFAVTMMIMSTMVSAIVQVLHDARRVRERHLVRFISALFDALYTDRLAKFIPHSAAKIAVVNDQNDQLTLKNRFFDRWFEKSIDLSVWLLSGGIKQKTGFVIAAMLTLVMLFLATTALIASDLGVVVALMIFLVLYLLDRRDLRHQQETPLQRQARLQARGETAPCCSKDILRHAFVRDMTTILGTSSRHSRATEISATDFAAKLAETEIGKAIMAEGEERAKTLIVDVARRFDTIGRGASASFADLSRRWSVYVAFVLAFAVNVDAITLLNTYFENPILAEKVRSLGEKSGEDLRTVLDQQRQEEQKAVAEIAAHEKKMQSVLAPKTSALAELDAEIKQMEAEGKDTSEKKEARQALSAEIKNAISAEELAALEEARRKASELKNLIRTTQAKIKLQLENLEKIGVPIGWGMYPLCMPNGVKAIEPRCAEVFMARDKRLEAGKQASETNATATPENIFIAKFKSVFPGPFRVVTDAIAWFGDRFRAGGGTLTAWFVGTMLSGALIGLGGPFWFDTFRRLSSVASLARSLGVGGKKPEAGDETAKQSQPKSPETAHAPADVVDAFLGAAKVNQMQNNTPGSGRPKMNVSGARLKLKRGSIGLRRSVRIG